MANKDAAVRMTDVLTQIQGVNVPAHNLLNAYHTALGAADRLTLSSSLAQGNRWPENDAAFTRKRALIRALMTAHLAVENIAPATLKGRFDVLTEATLGQRLTARLNWIAANARNAEQTLQGSATANCYAYAADDAAPGNGGLGGAIPGAASNAAPQNNADINALIAGALADGGNRIQQVQGTAVNPPARQNGVYLIALLTNNVGFHWIRRDGSVDGAWTWKDSNMGTVKLNARRMGTIPGNAAVKMYAPVTDADLNDLLVNNAYMGWGYAGMGLRAFFEVDAQGFVVSAR